MTALYGYTHGTRRVDASEKSILNFKLLKTLHEGSMFFVTQICVHQAKIRPSLLSKTRKQFKTL